MFDKKLVAIINKQIPPGVAMNALAHLSLGLGAHTGSNELHLMDYTDADECIYPNISKMPFIILESKNSNKLLALIKEAKERGVRYGVFTDTMTGGGWDEQKAKTEATTQDNLIFYGVILFGPCAIVSELTKKFSLWK